MSKKSVLIVLVLFSLITKAQNKNTEAYLPMAVENAQWLIYVEDSNSAPPFDDEYFGYYIKGDTIINSVNYKKVYYRSYSSSDSIETLPLTITRDDIFGAIREDVPNKKVYGIIFCEIYDPWSDYYLPWMFNHSCDCGNELLMYDFSMQIGDTYNGQCITDDISGHAIMDIQQQNIFGQLRNVQVIEIAAPWARIYEGVGGYEGLFDPVSVFIECQGFEGQGCQELVYYCIGTDQECLSNFVTLNLEENNLDNLISIYPNPVHNELTITNKSNINIKLIKIYDILGKELIETNDDKINLSNLTKGVYTIRIITKKGKSLTKKIIKS